MKVDFDSKKHQYKIDGVIVPGVTDILGQDTEVFKYAARKKGLADDYYAVRGTFIHLMTQKYDETGDDTKYKDHEWYGYLLAWIKFKTDNNVHLSGREIIVASKKLMLAGTLDVLCLFNKTLWILDIKSGSETETHKTQVSAYRLLYEQDPRLYLLPKNIGGVYLRPNGRYSFKEFKYDPYEVEYLRAKYEKK